MVIPRETGDRVILNGLDYLLAGVLAISTLAGFKKGMLRALGGIAGVLLAVAAANMGYKQLAFWLQAQWSWQSALAQWIVQRMPSGAIPAVSSGGVVMANQVYDLSYLLLLAISFTIILIGVCFLGQVLIEGLHHVLDNTPLSGINHLLGMAAGFLKSLLIIALLTGLIYPAAQVGASMGWDQAAWVYNQIDTSRIAAGMLILFKQLSAWLGFNA
ncbi:MAG: CvpA family protein [Syntrophomonadaceae bacterium]